MLTPSKKNPYKEEYASLFLIRGIRAKVIIPFFSYLNSKLPSTKNGFVRNEYMTDHAGPRRCECHLGTKFRHLPVEVTQFWHQRSDFGARFLLKDQTIILSVWNKTVTWTISNNFCVILFARLFFGLTKTGVKTATRVPKLGDRWAGASVVCLHM